MPPYMWARSNRRLNKLCSAVMRLITKWPEVAQLLAVEGANFIGNTPEEFTQFVIAEIAKWAKVVKVSGTIVD